MHIRLYLITAEYILPCQKTDPELNTCIKKSFNHLRPYLAKGLPELDVPAVEPLRIEELAMENNAGAVRIKALFTDITVKGPSNYTVRDVRSDISVHLDATFFSLANIIIALVLISEIANRLEHGNTTGRSPRQVRGDWQRAAVASPLEW